MRCSRHGTLELFRHRRRPSPSMCADWSFSELHTHARRAQTYLISMLPSSPGRCPPAPIRSEASKRSTERVARQAAVRAVQPERVRRSGVEDHDTVRILPFLLRDGAVEARHLRRSRRGGMEMDLRTSEPRTERCNGRAARVRIASRGVGALRGRHRGVTGGRAHPRLCTRTR